jgi:cyclic pyranopterin phosphate synthase
MRPRAKRVISVKITRTKTEINGREKRGKDLDHGLKTSSSYASAKMIDISEKPVVRREAIAEGTIHLKRSTMALMAEGGVEKGDPIQIATLGAIQAVKSTPSSLLMCHPIPIESSSIEMTKGEDSITARATVVAFGKTGVEMEALNAVTNALLNIWDVVKKYEKDSNGQYPSTRITDIHVIRKKKAGSY